MIGPQSDMCNPSIGIGEMSDLDTSLVDLPQFEILVSVSDHDSGLKLLNDIAV